MITLNLSVTSAVTTSLNEAICQGDSYLFGGNTIATAGTYNDTLTASGGCDSIVTLTLVVNSLPQPTITRSNDTLSTGNFSSYEWYLANNAISNSNLQQLRITQNGNYTVIVTDANGCSDTSTVFTVTGVGIMKFPTSNLEFWIYPNPANESVTIQSELLKDSDTKINIYDAVGKQIILNAPIRKDTTCELDISILSVGIYWIEVKSTQHRAVKQLVKTQQ
jgi:hypothetical protein